MKHIQKIIVAAVITLSTSLSFGQVVATPSVPMKIANMKMTDTSGSLTEVVEFELTQLRQEGDTVPSAFILRSGNQSEVFLIEEEKGAGCNSVEYSAVSTRDANLVLRVTDHSERLCMDFMESQWDAVLELKVEGQLESFRRFTGNPTDVAF